MNLHPGGGDTNKVELFQVFMEKALSMSVEDAMSQSVQQGEDSLHVSAGCMLKLHIQTTSLKICWEFEIKQTTSLEVSNYTGFPTRLIIL